MSFKISWRTHIIINIIALAIAAVLYFPITYIVEQYVYKLFSVTNSDSLVIYLAFFLFLLVPITIIHEAIHGIAHIYFGDKVKFGFKWIFAYTQETTGRPLNTESFCLVLLAPVIVITAISFLLPLWLGGMIYILNLLGSSGDIYMAFMMCRYNRNSMIIDKSYGFDIIE